MGSLLRAGAIATAAGGAAVWLSRRETRSREPAPPLVSRNLAPPPDAAWPGVAVVRGGDPAALVRRAVEELGGIRRFVARGDVVLIKPNMSWDRTPEQAANTNPQAVAAAVQLAFEAGARKVLVADVAINEPRRVVERSGIGPAVRAAGASIVFPSDASFRDVNLGGDVLREWPVFVPFLEADKVINFPIAKHHSLTGVTLGMKNWYGILGGSRYRLHQRIHESLADLAAFLRPTLTIIDAYRVLLRGGPSGGNLSDVSEEKTVIAGTDPVAVDAWAAREFWELEPGTLRYLELASRRGLGAPEARTRVVKL